VQQSPHTIQSRKQPAQRLFCTPAIEDAESSAGADSGAGALPLLSARGWDSASEIASTSSRSLHSSSSVFSCAPDSAFEEEHEELESDVDEQA
jgi:hypothetical protein